MTVTISVLDHFQSYFDLNFSAYATPSKITYKTKYDLIFKIHQ